MKKCIATLAAGLIAVSATFAADPAKPAPKADKSTKKNTVLVFVDMRRIFAESEFFKRIQANLKASEEAIGASTKPKFQELSEKRLAYSAQESKMTADEREKRHRELQDLQQEVGDIQVRMKAEVQQKQEEANKLAQETMDEIVGALSREFGWDAVFNKSFDVAIWFSPAVDQTDIILSRLNARPLPKHPLTAPPQAATATPKPSPAPPAPPAPPAAPTPPAPPAPPAGK